MSASRGGHSRFAARHRPRHRRRMPFDRPGAPDADGRRRPRRFPARNSCFERTRWSRRLGSSHGPSSPAVSEESRSSEDGSRRRIGRTSNRRVFAGGDAVDGGASVVEAVRQGNERRSVSTRACDEWTDRDPLACARRPGCEDRRTGACARADALRQSVQAFPEYGPERRGAPLRAFTRTSDSPDSPSRCRTSPIWSSFSSLPSSTSPMSLTACARGLVLVNADVPPASWPAGVAAFRRGFAAHQDSRFANVDHARRRRRRSRRAVTRVLRGRDRRAIARKVGRALCASPVGRDSHA